MDMNIGVIGAGSWGTALANLLAKKGLSVSLWAYEAELVERMQASRMNDLYLPEVPLADNLEFTTDLPSLAVDRQVLVLVPPSQVMRQVVSQLKPRLHPDTVLISASKGIENDSLQLMSEVLVQTLPGHSPEKMAFLSGPSFAREVAREVPTVVAAAAVDPQVARLVQELFGTDYFRVYSNQDVVGVEVGGALKNVIALAAGVCDGLGFGHNARAGLITRGLAEIARMGTAMGADPGTFAGLAGMGDLVLTCTGDLSRNRTVGMELGKGRKLQEILAGMTMVVEGVKTTLSAYQLSRKLAVEAPITEQMYQILYQEKDPRQAVIDLMMRELKAEGA